MVNSQMKRRDKTKPRGFNYRPSDPKKLKARAEASGGDFETYIKQGFDLYKPRNGENVLRIMPPTFKDAEHFGYEFYCHSFVGPGRSSFMCLRKMKNKPCAACELEVELRKDGDADDADKMKPKKKVIYWIRDREGEGDDPELWQASSAMDKEISGRCERRSGKVLEIDNPWEGHDVSFRKTGQMLKTRYTKVDVDSDATPLADSKKEIDRLLAFIEENPLTSVLRYHTYEQMEAELDGGKARKDDDLDDDEDEDEDEKPSKKGKGKRRVAASNDDDDEDDDEDEDDRPKKGKGKRKSSRDDDEEEDDDEDEDEKPKRRGRVASKDDDEDDADEDEDEDDEDEDDDKPAKRSSKRSSKRDDDEDEDDADDDEDEDDRPAKRRAKRDPEEDDDEDDERPSSRRAKRGR